LVTKFKKEQFDFLINYASESHVDRSISDPHDFAVNNTDLMINVLEYIRLRPNTVLLHMSTDEVYGALKPDEKNSEWERIYKPSNPYSASKASQECLAISYFSTYRLPIAIFNSTNMIGYAQNQEKFLPKVIRKVLFDEQIQVDTDQFGNMGYRKYVGAINVAKAVHLVMNEIQKNKIGLQAESLPQKFHVSGFERISNLDIVNIVADELKLEPKIIIAPSPRSGYDVNYELSISKLNDLGWKASTAIRSDIREVVRWTIKNSVWLEVDHKLQA